MADTFDPIGARAKAGKAKLSREQLLRAIRHARARALYLQTRGTPSTEEAGAVDPLEIGLGPPRKPVEGRHYGPESVKRVQTREDIRRPFMEAMPDVLTGSESGGRINLPAVPREQQPQDWEAILRLLSMG